MPRHPLFTRTVDAFLAGQDRNYVSAKKRFHAHGRYFLSYTMPIAMRLDTCIEVLFDTCAPSQTTHRHIHRLKNTLWVRNVRHRVVYALGAPVCPICGAQHGAGKYTEYWLGPHTRKTWPDAEAVCRTVQACKQAKIDYDALIPQVRDRGLVQSKLRYYAAVRDAGLDVLRVPRVDSWVADPRRCDRNLIVPNTLWVEPIAAAIIDLDIEHRKKRVLLKRVGADPEFRSMIETLARAPDALADFAANYLDSFIRASSVRKLVDNGDEP